MAQEATPTSIRPFSPTKEGIGGETNLSSENMKKNTFLPQYFPTGEVMKGRNRRKATVVSSQRWSVR
jgi:hypothetical protein